MTGWILLLCFVAGVGLLVWLIGKLPIAEPFMQIMTVIGIIAVVVVCIQFFFGVDLIASIRSAVH
jgi:hypothetical protein